MAIFHFENLAFKTARKLVIFAIGMTVLLIGVIFIFTPGPAVVVIPIGLAILATEFVWARHLLLRIKQTVHNAVGSGSPDCDAKDEHA